MNKPNLQSHPRPNAEYRWTKDKAMAFLEALAEGCSIAAASRRVGMSRKSAYGLRERLGGGFAGAWIRAADHGRAVRQSRRRRRRAAHGDSSGAAR